MEPIHNNISSPTKTKQKRKTPSQISDPTTTTTTTTFPLNELNQDLLETVLSHLPTSSYFRLTSVCKKWKSTANSPSFKHACSQIPTRQPFFLMAHNQPDPTHQPQQPIILDSAQKTWKRLNLYPLIIHQQNLVPVASSGGLVCYHNPANGFVLTNPITGFTHKVNPLGRQNQDLLAIGMRSDCEKLKLVLVMGELPHLKFRQYDAGRDEWGEEIVLTCTNCDKGDAFTQFFLSKCGNVVSSDIQRSPCKRFSSVLLTRGNGDEVLCFLSSSGSVVCCDLTNKVFFEYPRLMPFYSEYSIDLVECGGEMYVVLLSEFFESASVRVWRWDESGGLWEQVAAMPPWMSCKFYHKNVDVNCSGAGRQILVCLNSEEICSYVLCDLVTNEWNELPQFGSGGGGGEVKEFVCGFSFEPRIEAKV